MQENNLCSVKSSQIFNHKFLHSFRSAKVMLCCHYWNHNCLQHHTISAFVQGMVCRQAVTWAKEADILSIRPWGACFNEILLEILEFSLKKMHLKSHLRCQAFKCIHTPFIHTHPINPLRLNQIDHEFADIFKWIFLNENLCILMQISLRFFLKGPINNTPALVQTMAWHWTGGKPLSAPVMAWFTDA